MSDPEFIPFWWRFRITPYRDKRGLTLRIIFGFVGLMIYVNAESCNEFETRLTGIGIMFIPWKLRPGQVIPGKTFVHRTHARMETA